MKLWDKLLDPGSK